ncbi:hypothetical protein [Shimazuella kribbensis]|uniref:hypothetical protein n=1 Tax=Shimazuella kribbensis TaxID=139808 RepID=UPI00048EAA4D|nr:hypothetical protein [Shimazuella kribbensis]
MKYQTYFTEINPKDANMATRHILTIDDKVDLKVKDLIVIHGTSYIVFESMYDIITNDSESVFYTYIHLWRN